MKDISSSDLMSLIELKQLESFYYEAMKYWIGDERAYETNWKIFLEDYAQKGQK